MTSRDPRRSPNVRGILITFFTLTLVLAFAPTASAQKGGGGLGGGGGSAGGGGGKGGGGGSGRDKEKKPKPKRNEVTPTDPAAAREKLQTALVASLTKGTATVPFLVNLFDQASTGAVPASAQSRKALAEALGGLKGKKLEEAQATAIAEPLAMMVNADGVSAEDLTAKKEPLKEALGAAGLADDQVVAALAATDRMAADQKDEAIKKVMDDLDEIQKEGNAGDDRKKSLTENITALAGDAKPDETSVTKLAEHVVKGADAAQLTAKERAQIAYDIRAAVTGPPMPPAQLQPLLNELKAILKAGLVKGAEIQAIATDLQALNKALASAAPAAPATAPAAPAAGADSGEK